MSDKEARAVGAGEQERINGKNYIVKPVCFRDLQELQRKCIKHFKRSYLETFKDNLDLFPGDPGTLMREKMEEVARWDIDNLPKKRAFDARSVPINDELEKLLKEHYGNIPEDGRIRARLLSTMLDAEAISMETVEKLTGVRPVHGYVPYDSWWISADYIGMVSFISAGLVSEDGVTRISEDEISSWNPVDIVNVARRTEELTAPAMGNM